ncbi:MAG TPA: hypothetical protein VGI20_10805 [Rhizomicrobium sp.]
MRCDVREWNKNEPTLLKARMRQYRRTRLNSTFVIQKIEIEGAWSILLRLDAAMSHFNLTHCGKQARWWQLRRYARDGIHERRIGRIRPRAGRIE